MGESSVSAIGNRRTEESGGGCDKYLELSLKSRWIALAANWLDENCPCTKEHYLVQVSRLMPTHINKFRQERDPKFCAAKDAFCRLVGERESCRFRMENGVIVRKRMKIKGGIYGFGERFSSLIQQDEIDIRQHTEKGLERKSFTEWIKSRGFKSIGSGVYVKAKESI